MGFSLNSANISADNIPYAYIIIGFFINKNKIVFNNKMKVNFFYFPKIRFCD